MWCIMYDGCTINIFNLFPATRWCSLNTSSTKLSHLLLLSFILGQLNNKYIRLWRMLLYPISMQSLAANKLHPLLPIKKPLKLHRTSKHKKVDVQRFGSPNRGMHCTRICSQTEYVYQTEIHSNIGSVETNYPRTDCPLSLNNCIIQMIYGCWKPILL